MISWTLSLRKITSAIFHLATLLIVTATINKIHMTTTTQILSILSPVRIYCVDDWMKIANASFHIAPYPIKKVEYVAEWCIELQRRYEEMTIGNMLVEKMPSILKRNEGTLIEPIFQPALLKKEMFIGEKAWFEGFTESRGGTCDFGENLTVNFLARYESWLNVWFDRGAKEYKIQLYKCTVFDFIYEVEKHNNRTATDKISITPTEYFVEELLKTE